MLMTLQGVGISLLGVGGSRIIVLSGSQSQDEETAIGTTIGTLSVVGGSGVYAFTKTVDADGAFTLTGSTLKNAIVFDYLDKNSHSATFTADNGIDPIITTVLTVAVNQLLAGGPFYQLLFAA